MKKLSLLMNLLMKKKKWLSHFFYAAGPVGPAGITKLNTYAGGVPVIVTLASLPGAPVVTVPIEISGVIPSAPVGPVGPISP